MNCVQCGKAISGADMAFCPYCGAKLPEKRDAAETLSAEEEKWIRKAQAVTAFPERKKILLQGLSACPDSRAIRWELLFIGTPEAKKRSFALDFSIIKCYILEIYRSPGEFSEERRNSMRALLFDDAQLRECLAMYDDPAAKQREYIQRLCREYVEIFLEGSNQLMGNWFGIRIERNREKKLAAPVAEMIGRIRKDEKLLPEQREQLVQAMALAYAGKTGGNTSWLDELLD